MEVGVPSGRRRVLERLQRVRERERGPEPHLDVMSRVRDSRHRPSPLRRLFRLAAGAGREGCVARCDRSPGAAGPRSGDGVYGWASRRRRGVGKKKEAPTWLETGKGVVLHSGPRPSLQESGAGAAGRALQKPIAAHKRGRLRRVGRNGRSTVEETGSRPGARPSPSGGQPGRAPVAAEEDRSEARDGIGAPASAVPGRGASRRRDEVQEPDRGVCVAWASRGSRLWRRRTAVQEPERVHLRRTGSPRGLLSPPNSLGTSNPLLDPKKGKKDRIRVPLASMIRLRY